MNSQEQPRISAQLIAGTHGKLPLRELKELFADPAYTKAIHKNSGWNREPLWKCLLGVYEGPSIILVHEKSRRFFGAGVRAENNTISHLGFGVSSSVLEAVGGFGPNLTAATAYAVKRRLSGTSVGVSMNYVGISPEIPTQLSQGVKVELSEHKTHDSPKIPQEPLIFDGVVEIINARPALRLPGIVEAQSEVVSTLDGSDRSSDVLALFGADSFSQLEEAWQQAIAQPTAKSAAMAIQQLLS
jgi:hypothetical protein